MDMFDNLDFLLYYYLQSVSNYSIQVGMYQIVCMTGMYQIVCMAGMYQIVCMYVCCIKHNVVVSHILVLYYISLCCITYHCVVLHIILFYYLSLCCITYHCGIPGPLFRGIQASHAQAHSNVQ